MWTSCRCTRERFESTHGCVSESTYGFFNGFFSVPHHTHRTPNTHHDHQQHHTADHTTDTTGTPTHNITQHHTETETERDRETGKEDRERERDKRRQDRTREEPFCVVLCFRDPGDCLVVARRFFGMVSDGFQAQKRGSWIPGKEWAKESWQMRSQVTAERRWPCKFCLESNVWMRWRCRRFYSDIPAELQGKYRQAVAAKSGEWSAGSSTSSGEMDWNIHHVFPQHIFNLMFILLILPCRRILSRRGEVAVLLCNRHCDPPHTIHGHLNPCAAKKSTSSGEEDRKARSLEGAQSKD